MFRSLRFTAAKSTNTALELLILQCPVESTAVGRLRHHLHKGDIPREHIVRIVFLGRGALSQAQEKCLC